MYRLTISILLPTLSSTFYSLRVEHSCIHEKQKSKRGFNPNDPKPSSTGKISHMTTTVKLSMLHFMLMQDSGKGPVATRFRHTKLVSESGAKEALKIGLPDFAYLHKQEL